MKIVDVFDCVSEAIYTVELNKNVFVDVKRNRDLFYVMQNEDGTEAYNRNGDTFEYHFDEKEIISFVKAELNK